MTKNEQEYARQYNGKLATNTEKLVVT